MQLLIQAGVPASAGPDPEPIFTVSPYRQDEDAMHSTLSCFRPIIAQEWPAERRGACCVAVWLRSASNGAVELGGPQ